MTFFRHISVLLLPLLYPLQRYPPVFEALCFHVLTHHLYSVPALGYAFALAGCLFVFQSFCISFLGMGNLLEFGLSGTATLIIGFTYRICGSQSPGEKIIVAGSPERLITFWHLTTWKGTFEDSHSHSVLSLWAQAAPSLAWLYFRCFAYPICWSSISSFLFILLCCFSSWKREHLLSSFTFARH